jgi:HAD superfamily hydrolase (TIGR01509 family)
MQPLRAMLFDMDGTLVDSVPAHVSAWMRALRACGTQLTYQVVHDQIGKGADQLVPDLVGDETAARCGEAAMRLHDRIYTKECLPHLRIFPGVRPLFDALRDRGCRIAIVSSARRSELDRLVSQIAGPIDTVVCGDDVPRSKPDPALWRMALHRLGLTADQAMAIGDSPYDFTSAQPLGLLGTGVLTGGFPADTLLQAGARCVYADLDDLRWHLGDLLPLPKAA